MDPCIHSECTMTCLYQLFKVKVLMSNKPNIFHRLKIWKLLEHMHRQRWVTVKYKQQHYILCLMFGNETLKRIHNLFAFIYTKKFRILHVFMYACLYLWPLATYKVNKASVRPLRRSECYHNVCEAISGSARRPATKSHVFR